MINIIFIELYKSSFKEKHFTSFTVIIVWGFVGILNIHLKVFGF